ncbi:hypothetical protein XENTR_v10015077 [Xenopus tropicalis]|nr:hypothetical protein XENTR_v10015077 [Xenopus tropicalis]
MEQRNRLRQSYYTFKKMAQDENRKRHRSARIQTRKKKNSDYRIAFLPQNIQQQKTPTSGPSFLRSTKTKTYFFHSHCANLPCKMAEKQFQLRGGDGTHGYIE